MRHRALSRSKARPTRGRIHARNPRGSSAVLVSPCVVRYAAPARQHWIILCNSRCDVHQMDNWDDYRLILELDRCGTLRGAAEKLGITHSTVSRRLVALQDAAEAPLFERVAGGYRATTIGKQFVAAGQQIESITRSAQRQQRACGASLSGPLRLSISDALGHHLLFEMLVAFWQPILFSRLSREDAAEGSALDRRAVPGARVAVVGGADPS